MLFTPSLLSWRGLGDPASHRALHSSLQSPRAGSSSRVESTKWLCRAGSFPVFVSSLMCLNCYPRANIAPRHSLMQAETH